jgi:hypothetical protein
LSGATRTNNKQPISTFGSCTGDVTATVGRSRRVSAAYTIAESDAMAAGRTRTLAQVISEAFTYVTGLTVQLPGTVWSFAVTQVSSMGASLGRSRPVQASVAEAETSTTAVARVRSGAFAFGEAEGQGGSIRRARNATVTTISETEGQTGSIARARTTSIVTVSETESMVTASQRARGYAITPITEAEAHNAAIKRTRGVTSSVAEAESHTLAIERLRGQLLAIAETEGATVALGRARHLLGSIAEATGLTFTVDVTSLIPDSMVMTVSWNEWITTPTANGAKSVLTPFSEVIHLNAKLNSTATVPATPTVTAVAHTSYTVTAVIPSAEHASAVAPASAF